MKKKVLLFMICSFLSVTAFASYEEGVSAVKRKDYASAIQEFTASAEQGDRSSQSALGEMYQNGIGVERDFNKALLWHSKAAEQGAKLSQYNLGYMYFTWQGVNQEYIQALSWLRKAADQGEVNAQHLIGVMFFKGLGVENNHQEAFGWFRKAADQGVAASQAMLGVMYFNGAGVETNFPESASWYRKAAEQGLVEAQFQLGVLYFKGIGVEKNLKEADRLLKLAADKGVGKDVIQTIQRYKECAKKANTELFGELLNCTSREDLRLALINGGAVATRVDSDYWYDQYDSSAVMDGTSELSIGYIDGKFAHGYYKFPAGMDTGKVVEVRDMVSRKYGKPSISKGKASLGEVTYTWKLKDGVKLEVLRGWPDTTVYLTYTHLANYAEMQARLERQERAAEEEKLKKQSNAF